MNTSSCKSLSLAALGVLLQLGTACLPLVPPTDESVINTEGNQGTNTPNLTLTLSGNCNLSTGEATNLTVTALDGNQQTVGGLTYSWASDDSSVVTVNGSGVVSGIWRGGDSSTAVRVCTVNRTSNVCQSTNCSVSGRVRTISLSQSSFSLNPGGTMQLSASPKDASQNTVTYSVVWSSDNHNVATVDSTGLVTAAASVSGSQNTTIRACVDYACSALTVTVVGEQTVGVSQVVLSAPGGAIGIGASQALNVTVHFTNNTSQLNPSGAEVRSTNSSVISTSGRTITGVSAGTANIYGYYEGYSSTQAAVTVTGAANPALANTLLYLSGTSIFSIDASGSNLEEATNLGTVVMGSVSKDVTAPRFMLHSTGIAGTPLLLVGIGVNPQNQQFLYRRENDGSIDQLKTIDSLDTNGRGVSSPGSASAFGLAPPNHTYLAYTIGGSTTATVDLYLTTSTGAGERRIITDIDRATPTTDGRIAVIYFGNVYIISPPASLTGSSQPTIAPITTTGDYGDHLLFGRLNGSSQDTVIAVRDNGSNTVVRIINLDAGNAVSSLTLSSAGGNIAGGFVLSSGGGFLNGRLVFQRYASSNSHLLYAIDPEGAGTLTQLTHSLGAPVLDTRR